MVFEILITMPEVIIAAPVLMSDAMISIIGIMSFIGAVFENNKAILDAGMANFEFMMATIKTIIGIMNSKMPIIETIIAIMKTKMATIETIMAIMKTKMAIMKTMIGVMNSLFKKVNS